MDGLKCLECNSTKVYLEADACVNCSAPCLECKSKTECLSCAGNTTLLDLTILPGTINCKACSEFIPHCKECLSPTVCMSCETTDGPFFLTNPPSNFWINHQRPVGPVLKLHPTAKYVPRLWIQPHQQFANNAKMVPTCWMVNATHAHLDVLYAQVKKLVQAVFHQLMFWGIACACFVFKLCQIVFNVPVKVFVWLVLKVGFWIKEVTLKIF